MRTGPGGPASGDEGRRAEVDAKLTTIRGWLDERDLDAVLLGSQANFAWITGGGHSHISIGEEAGIATVLVTRQEAFVVTTNIEAGRLADEELGGLPFEIHAYPWHEPGALREFVGVTSDPARTVGDGAIGGWPVADPSFACMRYVMSAPEVDRYRALGQDAATAVETACRSARPGMSELDVAAVVASECAARGIVALVDLVAADDRIAAYRHPLPTSRTVAKTVLVALTGRRHGLHASLTRMVTFGAPDDDLRRRHEAVTRVDACEIYESRPGRSLGTVMRKGADRYAAEGFRDEWKLHHQGGLTGYAGREIFATPSTSHILEAGNVTAWNPFDHQGQIRGHRSGHRRGLRGVDTHGRMARA
ncbi:MAG: M24 family metallopeptidase [Actinomycetota bacterium]